MTIEQHSRVSNWIPSSSDWSIYSYAAGFFLPHFANSPTHTLSCSSPTNVWYRGGSFERGSVNCYFFKFTLKFFFLVFNKTSYCLSNWRILRGWYARSLRPTNLALISWVYSIKLVTRILSLLRRNHHRCFISSVTESSDKISHSSSFGDRNKRR